jgi:hypothetical protein
MSGLRSVRTSQALIRWRTRDMCQRRCPARAMKAFKTVISLFLVSLASCAGVGRYPDGYRPILWMLVVDHEEFLAYRVPDDIKPDSKVETGRLLFPPPSDVHWMPVSRLGEYLDQHCRETGVVFVEIGVTGGGLDDSHCVVSQTLGSKGFIAVGPANSVREMARDGERAAVFLTRLPAHEAEVKPAYGAK